MEKDVSTFVSIVTLSNPGFNITSEILETGIKIQYVPKNNRLYMFAESLLIVDSKALEASKRPLTPGWDIKAEAKAAVRLHKMT